MKTTADSRLPCQRTTTTNKQTTNPAWILCFYPQEVIISMVKSSNSGIWKFAVLPPLPQRPVFQWPQSGGCCYLRGAEGPLLLYFLVSERTLLEIIAEFFRPKKWSVFSFDFSSLKKFAQNRSTCFWKKENKQQQIPLQLGWSNQFRQSTTLTFVHHTRLSPFNRENNVISIKF